MRLSSTRTSAAILALANLLACVACGNKPEPAKENSTPAKTTATPSASSPPPRAPSAPAAASSAAPAASSVAPAASGSAGAPLNKAGVFTGVPAKASKVPTVAEWGAAPEIKDIPGQGSEEIWEIKNVREWVKVTARAYRPYGAGGMRFEFNPSPVKVLSGKDGNVFEFTAKTEELTSVVFSLVEGKEREFHFKYEPGDLSYILKASWAKGAPEARLAFRKGP